MDSFIEQAPGEWKHPSAQLLTMRTVEVFALTLLVAVCGGIIAGFSAPGFVAVLVVVAAVVMGVIWLVLERRRVKSWGYCEGPEELLVQRGLLIRRLSVVPYGRMQFIDVTAGPAERLFKLATVQLHTAAAATDARIPGLQPDEASRLRDQLAQLGESRLSGL